MCYSRKYDTPLRIESKMTEVLIIGGGFGGLTAAKYLSRKQNIHTTLIDRRNHHLFQPLLYQVATAGLSPSDVASPIRSIFAGKENVSVVLDEVISIDRDKNIVTSVSSQYPFDFLIVATGATHSYFGHNDWENHAIGLKTLEHATEMRRKILIAFELAEKELNPEKKQALLTFVIIGGGPTGVELAGAIAEISKYTLVKDFRNIDFRETKIILVEAGPRILSMFNATLSNKAVYDLEKLGVQVCTKARVIDIGEGYICLEDKRISARTILWAAGVKPSSLGEKLKTKLDPLGRVIVDSDLTINESSKIFVIGDLANFSFTTNGVPLPGIAPVAIQQGRCVAANIINAVNGKPMRDFHYLDKGMLATIGRRKAVGQYLGFNFSGLTAWLVWIFVHIYYLIGFKNKVFVLLQWIWSYFTFKKGARLILTNH